MASLLAKVLFMGNEEVRGIKTLHEALQETPMDYAMLDAQAEFLLKKARSAPTPEQRDERLGLARECADRSTVAAPSEFRTWARLAQVYVAMEDWEHALAVLNSCPMFTYQDKDAPAMPEPRDVYLPTLPATRLDEIDSEPESRYAEQVDPSLMNLRAAGYRGTFREAYNILTEMTAKLGWDQLLRIRSTVFVMEDEYRNERDTGPGRRNASMDGLRGSPRASVEAEGKAEEKSEDKNGDEAKENGNGVEKPVNGEAESPEKPSNTIHPKDPHPDIEKVSPIPIPIPQLTPSPSSKLTQQHHRTRRTPRTPSLSSTTSASASAGSTASSWSSTRTSASTPSGAPRWPSTAPSRCSTRSLPRSGRYSARSPRGCSTRPRPRRPTARAWRSGSRPRR